VLAALGLAARLRRELSRIRARLLVVHLVLLLVPVAGLEFARLHERQLLDALQRDMRDQAALVRAMAQTSLAAGAPLAAPAHAEVITSAARSTRTRVRLLDARGEVVADSHAGGPPEGPEPRPPSMLPRVAERAYDASVRGGDDRPRWPDLPDRSEVRLALAGAPAAYTRVREREPEVLLFVAEPIRHRGEVVGAVYVVRSTSPVLLELYRIRSGLLRVLAIAVVATIGITLLLAWSISRPLARLSRAAKRVAAGEPDVALPVSGGGEIRELGESFVVMKERLDARMRYISDFAADVAHEFKSPLTSIRGAAELLEEGAADDPAARDRFLRNITLDVARLDRLVSRLLELSRIEASSSAATIVDLEALARRIARREPRVEVRFEASTRFVAAREADLEAALANLVDNAARFTPAGEAVLLAIAGGPPDPSLRIRVVDRGPGVDPAHLPRIFDRFFTTDGERGGTGLGLAIVRAVAEAHGGSATVESRPGEGAAFTIELPVKRAPSAPGRASPRSA
jgi:two-component system sensor histidine kinase ChvG